VKGGEAGPGVRLRLLGNHSVGWGPSRRSLMKEQVFLAHLGRQGGGEGVSYQSLRSVPNSV
jgi:hypothetical protein